MSFPRFSSPSKASELVKLLCLDDYKYIVSLLLRLVGAEVKRSSSQHVNVRWNILNGSSRQTLFLTFHLYIAQHIYRQSTIDNRPMKRESPLPPTATRT